MNPYSSRFTVLGVICAVIFVWTFRPSAAGT
jgi:hypothetical protein